MSVEVLIGSLRYGQDPTSIICEAADKLEEVYQAYLKTRAENERLRKALHDAADALVEALGDVEHWASYAGEYFQNKHNLMGDLDRIREHIHIARSGEKLMTDAPERIWAWPSGNAASTSIFPYDEDTDSSGLVEYVRADLFAELTIRDVSGTNLTPMEQEVDAAKWRAALAEKDREIEALNKKFETLKKAYDRERRRPIQILGATQEEMMPSEKKIAAGLKGWADGVVNAPEGQGVDERRRYLVSAILNAAEQAEPAPAALSGVVKVRNLDWEETHSRRSDEDPTTEWNGGFEADSALGYYEISMDFGSDAYYWAVTNPLGDDVGSDFEDPLYAKAAAQADYERRILSALEPAKPATDAEQSSDWLRDTAMDVMLCTEVEKATRTLSLAMSRSPRLTESRLREALPALKAIAEGYKALGVKDRFIKVENPDFKEDDGSNPFLIIDVTALAQGADDERA